MDQTNVFLSPPQKPKTNEWRVYVTNYDTYFCDRLTELALFSSMSECDHCLCGFVI